MTNKVDRYTTPPVVPELVLLVSAYHFWLSTGTKILVEIGHSNRDNGWPQQRLHDLLQPNTLQPSGAMGARQFTSLARWFDRKATSRELTLPARLC